MEIIHTNALTEAQIGQIQALERLCFAEDALENHAYLSSDINFDRTIPVFWMAYEDAALIGFLTFFIPTKDEAEIAAFVHPAHRRKGVFARLDEAARREIAARGVGRTVYCVEAKSRSAQQVLRHWGIAEIERSEYRMAISRARVRQGWDMPADARFAAKRVTRESAAAYRAMSERAFDAESDAYVDAIITSATRLGYLLCRDDAPIGVFVLGLETPGEPCIYGVAIAEAERGKGYGRRLMALACELGVRHGETVQLDVDSSNPIAFRLYRGMGFAVTFQVDYYVRQAPREPSGYRKRSFALPYRGGMIWCEHLDALGDSTELALDKLRLDRERFQRPSSPSSIAIVLNETIQCEALLAAIADALLQTDKVFLRVCVIGADRKARRTLQASLVGKGFALSFLEDFEAAKEWLMP